ncbi:hypothetical protein H4F99_01520 [Lysobacter sp. SG-8]|uniref:Uncharacterized protein n=1 Tax=Marilutibacter penaei TaxID=2759900 RepID=A0A7W3U1D0_9GAMM|nr:hypothetical protein [Lysobacter penaei]MBB1087161.1 hypothetical protein [Lysobacter penaei]
MNAQTVRRPAPSRRRPHPLLDEVLRGAVAVGATLLLVLPEARGMHPALGWLPLWLLGMPLAAWWAAHRFPLPGRTGDAPAPRRPAATRRMPQARRRRRLRPGLHQPRVA